MSFNYQKLVNIHKASGEMSKDFAHAIFGTKSKLGPEYFEGKDSISTHHLELLCNHYHVPMNFFFDNSPLPQQITIGNVVKNNTLGVGNVNINSDVDQLNNIIKELKISLADKDNQLSWLKKQYEILMETLSNMRK
jgi:hypothetical protein